jgi:hypothetical protein
MLAYLGDGGTSSKEALVSHLTQSRRSALAFAPSREAAGKHGKPTVRPNPSIERTLGRTRFCSSQFVGLAVK